jgi:hypothetical protein
MTGQPVGQIITASLEVGTEGPTAQALRRIAGEVDRTRPNSLIFTVSRSIFLP